MSERTQKTVRATQGSEPPAAPVLDGKPTARRDLTEQEMWDQLTRARDLCSSEDQVVWSIFGTFWAANAILMVALFTTGSFPSPAVGMTISSVGALLSRIWHKIQRRALGHLRRYEELAHRLEDRLSFDTKYATSGNLNTEDYDEFVAGERPPARTLMLACSSWGTWLWLAGFAYFVVQAVTR